MNCAQALMKTLVDAGVEVFYSKSGTSEMHFLAALDSEPRMLLAVLCLFEGAATRAAEGFARMADQPAATLLHLCCGLGNSLANLHNVRKGKVSVDNIVGDQATYHVRFDSQLLSDIETEACSVSPGFLRIDKSMATHCQDAADALQAQGLPGQVATLILADVSWAEGGIAEHARVPLAPACTDDYTGQAMARVFRSGQQGGLAAGGGGPARTCLAGRRPYLRQDRRQAARRNLHCALAARRLRDKASEENVQMVYRAYEEMFHVWMGAPHPKRRRLSTKWLGSCQVVRAIVSRELLVNHRHTIDKEWLSTNLDQSSFLVVALMMLALPCADLHVWQSSGFLMEFMRIVALCDASAGDKVFSIECLGH